MAIQAERMADLTGWQILVGVAGLGMLGYTLRLTLQANKAAVRAAKAAEEEMERLERPYLMVRITKIDSSPDAKEGIRFEVKNFGRIFAILGVPHLQFKASVVIPPPITVQEENYKFQSIISPGDKPHPINVPYNTVSGEFGLVGNNGKELYFLAAIPYVHGERRYLTCIAMLYDREISGWIPVGGAGHNFMR